jgi:hypothetical protein
MPLQIPKDRIFIKSTVIEEDKKKVKDSADEEVKGTSFDFKGVGMIRYTLSYFFSQIFSQIINKKIK